MIEKRHRLYYKLIPLLLLFLTGCSNNYVDEIDRGSGYDFRPGYPELRFTASGFIDTNDNTKLLIAGDVVYGSLVFSENDGLYAANISIEIQITGTNSDNNTSKRRSLTHTIEGEHESIINSQDVYYFEEEFDVPPGDYEIQVVVIDDKSDQHTLRQDQTSIPNPDNTVSNITEIRVLGKRDDVNNSGFHQATTYNIPQDIDSLKFVFQLTNNNPDDPIEIETRLIKFRADTTIARPMSFNDYSSASLPYVGIDYSRYEVIQTSNRDLNQPGSVFIELIYNDLPEGNYRLEVFSGKDTENELYKAREFGIKSPNYPSLRTPEELAKPLYYLMSKKQYERLMKIENPDSLKIAIDRFWLSNIKNSNRAKSVINLFYERVEEANKQFSNFKEGWKTDPGMIYILFGPPMYSDAFSDQMIWSYSHNQNDAEKNFVFDQTKIKTKYYPFHHYVLNRSSYYHNIQYRQIERWLSGNILNSEY